MAKNKRVLLLYFLSNRSQAALKSSLLILKDSTVDFALPDKDRRSSSTSECCSRLSVRVDRVQERVIQRNLVDFRSISDRHVDKCLHTRRLLLSSWTRWSTTTVLYKHRDVSEPKNTRGNYERNGERWSPCSSLCFPRLCPVVCDVPGILPLLRRAFDSKDRKRFTCSCSMSITLRCTCCTPN